MKSTVHGLLNSFSHLIPLKVYTHIIQRDVVCIFYHAVSNDALLHVNHLYPVVSVSEFVAALEYLREKFTFVSYDELHDHHTQGMPLPSNSIHLSFDDGLSECYSVVRPILLEYQVPCTFFITIEWLDNQKLFFRHLISLCVGTALGLDRQAQQSLLDWARLEYDLNSLDMNGFIAWITSIRTPGDQRLAELSRILEVDELGYLKAKKPYLTTPQIQEMHSEGFTIGAHGKSHRKLGFIPETEMELEIVESCQVIKAITGQEIVPFSFPQSAGRVNRSRLAEILERYPFIGMMFDTKDLRLDEKFLVNRVWAERPLTPERKLHPLPEIIEQAYRDAWVHGIISTFGRR